MSGGRAPQSLAGRCPSYHTNVINGLAALQFDGVNDRLTNLRFNALSGATGATVFVVRRAADTQSHVSLATRSNSVIDKTANGELFTFATDNNYGSVVVASPTAWTIWNSVFDGSATGNAQRLALYLQGAPQPLSFNGTVPAALGTTNGYRIGRLYATNTLHWKGDIAEIIIYDRAINDSERGALTAYLGGKYGIATTPQVVSEQ